MTRRVLRRSPGTTTKSILVQGAVHGHIRLDVRQSYAGFHNTQQGGFWGQASATSMKR